MKTQQTLPDYTRLSLAIKNRGLELGFQQIGISNMRLDEDEAHLLAWLDKGMHGEMEYMARHGDKRSRPAKLLPGTISVISARMDYYPADGHDPEEILESPELAYVSRYALGRDYHKLIRKRLQKLADQIEQETGKFGYRCFTDSAPVLEKALARNGGLGWIGKHSNLINPQAGSWFFLGEIYTDLPLVPDEEFEQDHCGSCTACMDVCPTHAIVGPKQVDARRCISYLTIELKEAIPVEFRKLIGNRIYGCDDCQLVCPWNRFATMSMESDFAARNNLDKATLIELFNWSESEFYRRMEGSAIRRIGYQRWLRNIAVALGNAPRSGAVIDALEKRLSCSSSLVREHVIWALAQHGVERV